MLKEKIPGSFRDPSGFLFSEDGLIYRHVNQAYKDNYTLLINSGLYKTLVDSGLLVSHEEVTANDSIPANAYKILKPELIPFVSYPYEWCFSQLKDAALTLLKIQKIALNSGMTLKDGSAYNIQFLRGRPVLIDTLSFEKYREGTPWVAYRQFCQHFVAPLALMSYTDVRLNQLLRIHIDGIPLDLASALLPISTFLRFSMISHIHLHAKSQKCFAGKPTTIPKHKVSRTGLLALIDSLESTILRLKWEPRGTEWINYYEVSNYSLAAFQHKKQLVEEFISRLKPRNVWDLGANTGIFSRIASNKGIPTLSFDMDPATVEKNYLECLEKKETNILPLLLDLTNPSPPIGWENQERMSLWERGPADTALALGLIHHLAISNNLPMDRIASFFSNISNSLIIEFVPKSDSQVQRLLSTREDIFPDYTQQVFETHFGRNFEIQTSTKLMDSERILYCMWKK